MNRRDFSKHAFSQLLLLSAAQTARSEDLSDFAGSKHLPTLQGHTTATTAQFSILVPLHIECQFFARANGNIHVTPSAIEVTTYSNSKYKLVTVEFEDLSLQIEYQLVAIDSKEKEIDRRFFKTLDLNKPQARVALISCYFDGLHDERIWQSLFAQSPDVIVSLGDAVYVDGTIKNIIGGQPVKEKDIWRRYCQARQRLYLYKSPRLIPTWAVWDDHDYGQNNEDKNFPLKEFSSKVFSRFFFQNARDPYLVNGPGLSKLYHAFGQQFCLLDGRSFREKKKDGGTSPLGQEQEAWLFSQLEKYSSPAWLLLGTQWFGIHGTGESFENYDECFKVFINRLKDTGAKVLFGSGDVHYSEVMQIPKEYLGYETIEVTSSSMHSLKSKPRANPRRLEGCSTSTHNYVLLDLDLGRDSHSLTTLVTSISARAREFETLFCLDI